MAIHTPAELADLFACARELTDTGRAVLAADFLRIRGETGLLRRWEEGRILGVPTDRYNPLLLALAIADFPPPPGFEIVLLILPACALLLYLRVPVHLRWQAESARGRTPRVARDGLLGGGAIALLSIFSPGEPGIQPELSARLIGIGVLIGMGIGNALAAYAFGSWLDRRRRD